MKVWNTVVAAGVAAFTLVVAHVAAEGQAPAPPQATAAPAPQSPAGTQGRGRGPGTFPAQQRPPGDPAIIERGRAIYTVSCSACHGADLRGGQLGGPNLLRSPVVLNDQRGELILPVVRGSRAERGMPPLPMSEDDVTAVAEFLHSRMAASRGQGAPPPSDTPVELNILVGDASAGQAFFAARCSACHSPTGDLQAIATRIPDPKALQNTWVAGGGRGGRGVVGTPSRRTVTATVTLSPSEKVQGRLLRVDDFTISLAMEDGSVRTIRRDGDRPSVEIHDPLAPHRALLAIYTDKDMHDMTAYLVTLK